MTEMVPLNVEMSRNVSRTCALLFPLSSLVLIKLQMSQLMFRQTVVWILSLSRSTSRVSCLQHLKVCSMFIYESQLDLKKVCSLFLGGQISSTQVTSASSNNEGDQSHPISTILGVLTIIIVVAILIFLIKCYLTQRSKQNQGSEPEGDSSVRFLTPA